MSRSTHSSRVYLGLSKRYLRLKPGSTRLLGNHSCIPPLNDSIGETSSKSSARPSFKNQLKESSCTSMRKAVSRRRQYENRTFDPKYLPFSNSRPRRSRPARGYLKQVE